MAKIIDRLTEKIPWLQKAAALHVPDASALLTGLRFLLALLVLLVPTARMGASLPVLSEAVLRSRERFAFRLGLFYGSNTAGATLGVRKPPSRR